MEVTNQEDRKSVTMAEDLFAQLPPEITTDILSRLSMRSIALCKCVRKAWRDLLETDHFVNSYHSKSCAALALPMPATGDSNWLIVFELEDDLDSYNPITEFNFPHKARFEGSTDDLILLRYIGANDLYVCNPITREFIKLRSRRSFYDRYDVAYGIGVSKVSRQHKVVRLESENHYCHVYTLGTGRWRKIEAPTVTVVALYCSVSANGELYWLALGGSIEEIWICCFDIETERFSEVPHPANPSSLLNFRLLSLRDSLCGIDDPTADEIMIWSWKGSGAEKSWRLEYVLDQHPEYALRGFNCIPLHVFKNGDLLVLCVGDSRFLRYSIGTEAYQEIPSLGASAILYRNIPVVFTPSLRSLKNKFDTENVITF